MNDAPVAVDGTASTDEDPAVTITLSASDIGSGSLGFSIVTGPSHGTLGSITGTGTNYAFSGFFQPVDNPPVVNTVNSGQSIPEKWPLFNAATGAAISDPSSFVSFTSYQVSCTTWLGDPSSAINEVASGSSGLQYLGSGN